MKNIRHGDMVLEEINQLPCGLKKSDTEILMTGSGGNNHTYQDGEFYPKQVDQFIFGYFRSGVDCKLLHKEHGKKEEGNDLLVCIIPANKIFALRKQQEFTHDGMKPVID